MFRHAPLAVVLLFPLALPLAGREDPLARARRAVEEAEASLRAVQTKLDAAYKAVEQDHALVRSPEWPAKASPYRVAILAEVERIRKDANHSPREGLRSAFEKAGFLSPLTADRLAAALVDPLRKAAAGEGAVDAARLLADAVEKVLPGEDARACWEKAFLDLPVVAEYGQARAALDRARAELAALEKAAKGPAAEPEGMVHVPRGRFRFGPWTGLDYDLKRNRAERVRLEGFYIDVHEVTNGEFRDFLAGLGKKEQVREWLPTGFRLLEDGRLVLPDGGEKLPVRSVSYQAALAFARARGCRLPTEAEWEKAARGTDGRTYPWGNELLKDAANYLGRGVGGPVPVGSNPKDRSPYGVLDMAGNVSELTSTLAGRKPAKGKLKATDAIIIRGGSYADDEKSLSTTYRWQIPALGGKKDTVGFRCAVSEKEWKRRRR